LPRSARAGKNAPLGKFATEEELPGRAVLLNERCVRENRPDLRQRASGATLYNYFRDYDPSTGRYIEPEPLGLAGEINLYRYARSNPLTFFDPDANAAVSVVPSVLSGYASLGSTTVAAGGSTVAGAGAATVGVAVAASFAVGYGVGTFIYPTVEPFLSPLVDACFRAQSDKRSPLDRCLDAAAAGGGVWETFCRSLKDSAQRAGCWAVGPESENRKRGWCFLRFGKR